MDSILEFLKGMLSSEDIMDSEIYVQTLGKRIAETGVPKAKAKFTVIREEDGNQLVMNVTAVGSLDCGHWNVLLGGSCCECSATSCTRCLDSTDSKNGGFLFSCSDCGRQICKKCANRSILDPETVLCQECRTSGFLPRMIKRLLFESRARQTGNEKDH